MFDRRHIPVLLAPAVVASAVEGAVLAGCGISSGHASGGQAATGTSAGAAPASSTLRPGKLRDALLTRINGIGPASVAEDGSYAALPAVQAAAAALKGVSVRPQECAQGASLPAAGATGTGIAPLGADGLMLGSAPAAVVTFKVGTNSVWEVLAALSNPPGAGGPGALVPAQCRHYTVTSGGRTYQYTVTQSAITGIGKQARELNAAPAGDPRDDLWSVAYWGGGFVGAVTVKGPDASREAVRELGQQAYTYAAKTLG